MTGNKWGAISVMAHEIAHHLEAHTIRPGGSNREHELEADEVAGWMLRKLGATLAEAQALFMTFDQQGTATHPPRSARLAAVANGWTRAQAVSPTSCYAEMPRTGSARSEGGGNRSDSRPPVEVSRVDFGDDSGRFRNDGECDDARFTGPGRSVWEGHEFIRRDATDCRRLFSEGRISLPSGVDFGDDSGRWPHDGECDDVRFVGLGRSVFAGTDYIRRDASDCEGLFHEGGVYLPVGQPKDRVATGRAGTSLDFGDDSGRWPDDGECDDARFAGLGSSSYTGIDSVRGDASDCRQLFNSGRIRLRSDAPSDFGDDSGRWAYDGECDDSRFTSLFRDLGVHDYVRRDASDCRELLEEGRIAHLGDP